MDFLEFTHIHQKLIHDYLDSCLPSVNEAPEQLHQAMRYSVLNGGKRIRPLLVYAVGSTLGMNTDELTVSAAAVELIHCYSLIHDDLPAMDDDDLRRGKPTCHKAFDEATAILAGDALQALAFEILAQAKLSIGPERQLHLFKVLSHACGSQGMAGGQALDLAATGKDLDVVYVENMHNKKTGALITASAMMGAITAGANKSQLQVFQEYGDLIGLAFQIQDDILDIEGETELLGKTQGADIAAAKLTYPAVAGLNVSKYKVQWLHKAAMAKLASSGLDCPLMVGLSDYLIHRQQ